MNKKLWTPGGDVPVGGSESSGPAPSAPGPGAGAPPEGRMPGGPGPGPGAMPEELSEEDIRAQLEILAQVPVGGIVLEFASTLLTVAQLHLHPEELGEAQFALDTLSAVVAAGGDRLGPALPQLQEALRQVQMIFVQVAQAAAGDQDPSAPAAEPTPTEDGAGA